MKGKEGREFLKKKKKKGGGGQDPTFLLDSAKKKKNSFPPGQKKRGYSREEKVGKRVSQKDDFLTPILPGKEKVRLLLIQTGG